LGVDREGEIYIVETKLYKNADKRVVVAQVLDYGANLWKYGQNFDDFISRVEEQLNKAQHVSLNERLREFYGLDEEETDSFRQTMRQNLSEGSFKFVVLMDALHEGLKDLIVFLNQNTRFSLYAVEVEYYKHDGFEIVIPKLFGAESPKLGGGSPSTRRKLTEAEFLKVLGDNAGPEIAMLAEQTIQEARAHGLDVATGGGVMFKIKDEDSSESFNFGQITTDGRLKSGRFSEKCVRLEIVPNEIWRSYYDSLVRLIPGSKQCPWTEKSTNGEMAYVGDEDGNEPSVEPLLRKRDQWFKIIKGTMDQIRPFLTGHGR
jgi:hypothetical protein